MGRAVSENVPGPFFVNDRCIDCGTCWTFDPEHYSAAAQSAFVHCQPVGHQAQRQALLALQACPVAAIETSPELLKHTPADGFPALITRQLVLRFFIAVGLRAKAGARSWLVKRTEGNVLIDVPRWSALAAGLQRWAALARWCSPTATMWRITSGGRRPWAARAGFIKPMAMRRPRRASLSGSALKQLPLACS